MSTSTPNKRVAIVTGASQGIGLAIARRLAKDGFDLGLFDLPRSQNALEEAATGIRQEYGARVVNVYGDVSVEDDVKGLVDTVVQELGGLYAMIANAGIGIPGTLHETTTEVLDKMINVNIKGVFFSYKYAALRMIEQGTGGRIVGASSILGKKGNPHLPIYSATKFAVRGLTQAAAMGYGKHGITVNAYAPGVIETAIWTSSEEERKVQPVGPLGGALSRNALGRVGQPDEIANLVSFFVSDDAAFITGQSYNADGGFCYD